MLPMNMPAWDRVKAIFAEASALAPDAVAPFLDAACVGDVALRREVEALLAAQAAPQLATGGAARELAQASTLRTAALAEGAGSIIGPYKLLQLIGEGGFGSVFLAEQSQPVRRRVAVKIIKLGMDTKQVVARFEAERQALALMDHPHIARVLDGGATPLTSAGGGRPYFVMEYVVGDAITKFADAHKLSLAERLDLFQQVCSAVQHAHTKGIIHRDLKPGNVLVSMVDGKPFAKVIDFGIAKATAQPLTEKTLFTEHRQLIGTPEYMSPEQAEGSVDIDTRTDVYALGVLLYELLTGTTPIDSDRLRSAAFDEMRRMIREDEPLPPSVKLRKPALVEAGGAGSGGTGVSPVTSRRGRPSNPAQLLAASKLIAGELDWIVLKALEKERARRYETPSALADDVRRHLAGEAVVAAPVSRAYRVRKFVRRNKGVVGATAAITVTLLLGIAGTTWQWNAARSAERMRAAEARALDSALQEVSTVAEQTAQAGGPGIIEQTDPENLFPGITLHDPVRGRTAGFSLAAPSSRTAMLRDQALWYIRYSGRMQSKLSAQRDAAQAGVNKMLSTITGGTTWTPIESATLPDGRPATEDPLQFVISIGQSAAESLRAQTDAAEWSAYTANLALAQAAMEANDFPETRNRLVDAPVIKRGWEHRFVELASTYIKCSFRGVSVAALSPDARTVVMADYNEHALHIVDLAECRILGSIPTQHGSVLTLAFSADSSKFVAGFSLDRVLAFSTNTGFALDRLVTFDALQVAELSTFDAPGQQSFHAATFSPDGTRLLTGGSDQLARVWDLTTQRELFTIPHAMSIGSPQFSSDGARILTKLARGGDAIWSSQDGSAVSHDSVTEKATFEAASGEKLASDSYELEIVEGSDGENTLTISLTDQYGGPELWLEDNWNDEVNGLITIKLRIAAILASSPNGPSGLTLTTPDGSRRIVGGSDKTVRFFEAKEGKPTLPAKTGPATTESPEGVYREVAVFRMPEGVTNLQMTGDGTRLIIHLDGGSARVWDIRDPEERRKDLQAEWAERVPAGQYLDVLWASDTPDDKLHDAVLLDASLTPLRRLVAAEMLEERLEDDRLAAEQAFAALIKDQTDEAVLEAAVAGAELPARIKARVVALAKKWEYSAPTLASEKELATASALLEQVQNGPMGYADARDAARRVVEVRTRLLGPKDLATAEALHSLGQVEAFQLGLKSGLDHLQQAAAIRTELLTKPDLKLALWESFLASAALEQLDIDRAVGAVRRMGSSLQQQGSLASPSHELVYQPNAWPGPGFANEESGRETAKRWAEIRRDEVLEVAVRQVRTSFDWYKQDDVKSLSHIASLRWRLSSIPELVAAAGEIDMKADPTLKAPLTAEEHRQRAREALAKARALMAPAADGTPSPWANDEDAKALLAEAQALIEGAP